MLLLLLHVEIMKEAALRCPSVGVDNIWPMLRIRKVFEGQFTTTPRCHRPLSGRAGSVSDTPHARSRPLRASTAQTGMSQARVRRDARMWRPWRGGQRALPACHSSLLHRVRNKMPNLFVILSYYSPANGTAVRGGRRVIPSILTRKVCPAQLQFIPGTFVFVCVCSFSRPARRQTRGLQRNQIRLSNGCTKGICCAAACAVFLKKSRFTLTRPPAGMSSVPLRVVLC